MDLIEFEYNYFLKFREGEFLRPLHKPKISVRGMVGKNPNIINVTSLKL